MSPAEPRPAHPLAPGGAGPHNPDMDARIDALESETRETRAVMARIDVTLARIDERMSVLATKGDIAGVSERVSRIEERLNTLATKDDLAALALATKTDISAVAERVAKVEGMVEKLPTTLQLLGFVIALVFTVMGGAFGIVRLLHP